MMKYVLMVLAIGVLAHAGLLAQSARADNVPVTFQKERLVLHPKRTTNPNYINGVLLEVDVHTSEAHNNPDWLQLSGYKPGTGFLKIFPNPAPLRIERNRLMAPVDVIAINQYGRIVMIAPSISLNNLTEAITRPEAISALLYTQAELASTIELTVGDEVEYKLFKKPPLVVDQPSQEPPTPASDTSGDGEKVPTEPSTPNGELPQSATPNINAGTLDSDNRDGGPIATDERRRPVANPVTPLQGKEQQIVAPETPAVTPLLDTILKRHHQPNVKPGR